MRKHNSIIARLNPADVQELTLMEPNSQVTTIRFIDGERRLGFGLGQMITQLLARGIYPSESAIDLAILAATATAADTRISRKWGSQDSWTREIDLYVPVAEPSSWFENTNLIERILAFLTGDRWRIFFRARQGGLATIINRPSDHIHVDFNSVCLFSG